MRYAWLESSAAPSHATGNGEQLWLPVEEIARLDADARRARIDDLVSDAHRIAGVSCGRAYRTSQPIGDDSMSKLRVYWQGATSAYVIARVTAELTEIRKSLKVAAS